MEIGIESILAGIEFMGDRGHIFSWYSLGGIENLKLVILFKKQFIQPSFFGIHFGSSRNYTNMESAEMIVLLYRAERIGGYGK